MARIAIVTDSTADLPADIIDDLGISVVPLNIRIGDRSYEDRETITPEMFMQLLTTESGQAITSAPSVGRFATTYERLAETHDQILSIHISSKLSGTYSSACVARDLFVDGPEIVVLDSASVTMGLGLAVIRAANLANAGASLEEIQREVKRLLSRTHVIFLVDTLEHLRRGGRIGRAAEIIGSVLQLKPLLRIEEGIVVPQARTRTRARAVTGLRQLIDDLPEIEDAAIVYTAGADDIGLLADSLIPRLQEDSVMISELSPVLAAHIGPKGLGVAIVEGESA